MRVGVCVPYIRLRMVVVGFVGSRGAGRSRGCVCGHRVCLIIHTHILNTCGGRPHWCVCGRRVCLYIHTHTKHVWWEGRTDGADEEALEVGGHILLQFLHVRDGGDDVCM